MRRHSQQLSTSAKRVAFTLIELLVVIVIISLLATILFPLFAYTREKGRQSACLSNAHQLALAVLMYAQDSDETLPPVALGTDPSVILWPDLLTPYIRSDAVRRCPSDPDARNSYGLNEITLPDLTDPAALQTSLVTLAAFQTPAGTVMLDELGTEDDFRTPRQNAYKLTAPGHPLNDDADARPDARHTGRASIALMDGHAKAMRLNQFYMGQTPLDRCFVP